MEASQNPGIVQMGLRNKGIYFDIPGIHFSSNSIYNSLGKYMEGGLVQSKQ